jgi:MFS family permease
MHKPGEVKSTGPKFGGITIPPDLTKANFWNLYIATFLMGCLMTFPAICQAPLLRVLGVAPENAGTFNAGLQNMSQVATLLFVGYIGYLSDKHGRRILAIIGFIVCAVFYILFGYTKEISLAMGLTSLNSQVAVGFVIRFVIGIGLILGFPQFITMVADYTLPQDRGKGMAFNGICMGLASLVVAGILSAIARKTGLLSIFYMAAIAGILGVIVCKFGLVDRIMAQEKKKSFKEIWQIVAKSMDLKVSYVATFVSRADVVVIATLLSAWLVNVVGKEASLQAIMRFGIAMAAMSIVAFVAFPVLGILLDKWGRVPVLILSLLTGGTGLCLIGSLSNPFSPLLFLYIAIVGIGMAGSVTGANTLATDAAPKGMTGVILGGLNSMQPVGILFFLQFGGFLFDKLGPWSCFVLKGVADIIVGIWIILVKGKIKTK